MGEGEQEGEAVGSMGEGEPAMLLLEHEPEQQVTGTTLRLLEALVKEEVTAGMLLAGAADVRAAARACGDDNVRWELNKMADAVDDACRTRQAVNLPLRAAYGQQADQAVLQQAWANDPRQEHRLVEARQPRRHRTSLMCRCAFLTVFGHHEIVFAGVLLTRGKMSVLVGTRVG